MKQRLLLIFPFLFTYILLTAQSMPDSRLVAFNSQKQAKIRAKFPDPETDKLPIINPMIIVGLNAAQVAGDNLAGYRKFGGNFGGGAFIRLPKNFSVSFEILYSMKGSRSSSSEIYFTGPPNNPDTGYVSYKLILDYIDLPIMVNYHDKDRAIFGLGIVYNNLIRSKEFFNDREADTESGLYKARGVEFVASVTFLIKGQYGINLRGQYSLNNLATRELEFSPLDNGAQRSNYLTFRFMYLFFRSGNPAPTE